MPIAERVAPVWQESRGLYEEFKAFIRRGNVIDLAVGVIMGAAFGKIVSSLVGDVLMPPIGYALGNVDFKDLAFTLLALCVFVLVKVINRMYKAPAEEPKAPSDEVRLLTEIRDLLKTPSSP